VIGRRGFVGRGIGGDDFFHKVPTPSQLAARSSGAGLWSSPVLTDPYSQDAIAYACVRKRADGQAQIPLKVYDRDPVRDEEAEELTDGPIVELLDTINPLIDPSQLNEQNEQNLALGGEAPMVLTDKRGNPVRAVGRGADQIIDLPERIWPLRAELLKLNNEGGALGWKVRHASEWRDYPYCSVLVPKYPNPSNPLRGLGPMGVAFGLAAQTYMARQFQNSSLEGGGDTGGVLTVDGVLADEQYKRILDQLDDQWNNTRYRGRWKLVEEGTTAVPFPHVPRDVAYPELIEGNNDTICAVLGVPPALLGDQAENYATFKGHWRVMWVLTLIPDGRRIENAFNRGLFPRLRDRTLRNVRVRFDYSQVEALQGEAKDQVELYVRLVERGVPPNQALVKAGLDMDPIEGGDTPLMMGQWTPLEILTDLPDEDLPAAPPSFTDEDDDEDVDQDQDEAEDDEERTAPQRRNADPLETRDGRLEYLERVEGTRRRGDIAIAKAVRLVFRRWRGAQLRHLDAVANGERADVERHHHGPEPRVPPAVLEALLDSDESEWATVYPRSQQMDHARLREMAILQRVEISAAELDELIAITRQRWIDEMNDALTPAMRALWASSAEAVADELGIGIIGVNHPDTLVFLRDKAIQVSEGINSTVAEDIRRVLAKALAEGDSVGTIREKLMAVLPEAKNATRAVFNKAAKRALTIANTETSQINNRVRHDHFMEASDQGIVTAMRWITSDDDNVRPAHVPLDGIVKQVGQTWTQFGPNGQTYEAPYPAYHLGPPWAVINERCAHAPVIAPPADVPLPEGGEE
jgi:HK97 family phage portal protein